MDAIKFLKAVDRMCEVSRTQKGGCEHCPFHDNKKAPYDCQRSYMWYYDTDEITYKEMVFKVGKWDKEHPVKTRQSEFLKVFPRASLTGNGILTIKPCVIDTEIKRSDKQCVIGCYGCRKAYWLAEVKDENKN